MSRRYQYNPFTNALDGSEDLTETITLDNLSNVTVSSPADNEVLAYNNATTEWINQTAAEAGLATIAHAFVTIGADATLTGERALTGTANQINITDNGANGTVVLSTPQAIHTGADPTFADITLTSINIGGTILDTNEWAYLDSQDQAVNSGATPTFTGTNFTGVPAAGILAGTFGTGAYVFDNTVQGITALDCDEIANLNGDLKIQPDVQGDVHLFGDTNVATAGTDGKALWIHRKATAETTSLKIYGEDDMSMWVEAIGSLYLSSSAYVYLDTGTATHAIIIAEGGAVMGYWVHHTGFDQWAIIPTDAVGNQLILGDYDARWKDFDHVVQTDPTFFIHDQSDPDVSNNLWGSFHHDGDDFYVTTGALTGAGGTPATVANRLVLNPTGGTYDAAIGKLSGYRTLCIPVTNPTATDDYLIYKFKEAVTIVGVSGCCMDGTSVVFQIMECDGDGDNPAQIIDALTATTSDVAGNITNAGVDAGDYISYDSSAVTGATKLLITIDYTID